MYSPLDSPANPPACLPLLSPPSSSYSRSPPCPLPASSFWSSRTAASSRGANEPLPKFCRGRQWPKKIYRRHLTSSLLPLLLLLLLNQQVQGISSALPTLTPTPNCRPNGRVEPQYRSGRQSCTQCPPPALPRPSAAAHLGLPTPRTLHRAECLLHLATLAV